MSVDHLQALSGELVKLKSAGHSAIALADLIPYVNALADASKAGNPVAAQQAAQRAFEAQLALKKEAEEWNRELFRAVIESGQSALKSLSLINGAAAVALLAFLGTVLQRGIYERGVSVAAVSQAMVVFAVGVLLAGAGFGLRYLSQTAYTGDYNAETKRSRHKRGDKFRYAAVMAGACSLIAFGVGILLAFRSFNG